MPNIFESTTNEQKTNKPEIADVCDYFLTDKTLRKGMAGLLECCQSLKMKPTWVQKNGFTCSYRGNRVISFMIAKDNYLRISVYLAEKEDLEELINAQSDDLQTEFSNRKMTHCRVCKPACRFKVNIKLSGKPFSTCSRFNYMVLKPTMKQFKIIERFIHVRREYIDNKKSVR